MQRPLVSALMACLKRREIWSLKVTVPGEVPRRWAALPGSLAFSGRGGWSDDVLWPQKRGQSHFERGACGLACLQEDEVVCVGRRHDGCTSATAVWDSARATGC